MSSTQVEEQAHSAGRARLAGTALPPDTASPTSACLWWSHSCPTPARALAPQSAFGTLQGCHACACATPRGCPKPGQVQWRCLRAVGCLDASGGFVTLLLAALAHLAQGLHPQRQRLGAGGGAAAERGGRAALSWVNPGRPEELAVARTLCGRCLALERKARGTSPSDTRSPFAVQASRQLTWSNPTA